jgi:hypothetical protein
MYKRRMIGQSYCSLLSMLGKPAAGGNRFRAVPVDFVGRIKVDQSVLTHFVRGMYNQ